MEEDLAGWATAMVGEVLWARETFFGYGACVSLENAQDLEVSDTERARNSWRAAVGIVEKHHLGFEFLLGISVELHGFIIQFHT